MIIFLRRHALSQEVLQVHSLQPEVGLQHRHHLQGKALLQGLPDQGGAERESEDLLRHQQHRAQG